MNAWLRCYRPLPTAGWRLVAFPHAGGAASFFRPWAGELPASVELLAVQYPGRADRLSEAVIDRMDRMADLVAEALLGLLDRPLLLFGHSLGAAVAFEVALRLRSRAAPAGLAVSGQRGPSVMEPGDRHLWPDELLWDDVRKLNGTAASVLDHPELTRMVLPYLRSDHRLLETYRPRPASSLDCPITALVGDRDPELTVDHARRWAEVTRGAFDLRVFPGGDHFYLVGRRSEVVDHVLGFLGVPPARRASWPSTP